MHIWEVLGIPPTRDRHEIERAYEQQLKFVDPEQDPESWQTLHAAYEKAVHQAGGTSESIARPDLADMMDDADLDMAPEMPEEASPETELRAGQVMMELETLYANPGWRKDLQRWRAQLEGERAHKPGVTEVLRFTVFEFIERQSLPGQPAVPEEILDYLDSRLGWSTHRDQLTHRFSAKRVAKVLGGGSEQPAAETLVFRPEEGEGEVPATSQGLGIAIVGWIVALMILTMIFSELAG